MNLENALRVVTGHLLVSDFLELVVVSRKGGRDVHLVAG